MERIAIFGAGAVGSYLGAFMTRQGEDVTLIDQWPAHVEAIKANGMSVTGTQGPFTVPVKAVHLHEAQALRSESSTWRSLPSSPTTPSGPLRSWSDT